MPVSEDEPRDLLRASKGPLRSKYGGTPAISTVLHKRRPKKKATQAFAARRDVPLPFWNWRMTYGSRRFRRLPLARDGDRLSLEIPRREGMTR
jgi:hypothetical protein